MPDIINTAALWYFETLDLYNLLCSAKVRALAGSPEFRTYKKGEFIYQTDEDSTHIYLIKDGRIKIGHCDNEGNEVVKSILTRGEIFGELGLAGEDKRKDFAMALSETVISPLTIKGLKELMYQDRELNSKILRLIGLRLMKVERKLELLAFKDARTRIVEFLKDAATWKGKKVGFETAIFTKLTHKDIAALTGTSRQTVTTILNKLKEQNAINFDRRKILIRDLPALK
jgi:CRP/FNR family transcriptional regulator, cyclic AMP receptor protein